LEPDAGDGRLSNDQQALYSLARKLLDAFKANARANEIAWRRLEASFDQAQHSETRVASDNGRPTLNYNGRFLSASWWLLNAKRAPDDPSRRGHYGSRDGWQMR